MDMLEASSKGKRKNVFLETCHQEGMDLFSRNKV